MRDCKEENDFERVNDVVMVGKEACFEFFSFFRVFIALFHQSFMVVLLYGT